MPTDQPSPQTTTSTAPLDPPNCLGRPFHLLWAGQSLSLIGDQITLIALPLLAVRTVHAGTVDVGTLGACLRVPFLVLGLPAGVWVARAGLLRSMLGADLVRGLAIGLLPVVVLYRVGDLGVLLAGAILLGAGTVFFQIAYQSVVPELLQGEARWHRANTRLSLSESVALLVGPALGGLVVTALSPAPALELDALSYAVSVVSLLAVLRRRHPPVGRPAAGTARRLDRQILAGLRYVRRNPVLNAIMWTGALYNLGSAMYDSMLVLFAVRYLHQSTTVLGLAVGLGAVGFPIGSVLSRHGNARFSMGPTLILAAIPSVAGLLVAALATRPYPGGYLAAGTFLVGLGQGCFSVNAVTLRQLNSDAEMRPQATSIHRFVSWGALPLGSLAAGFLGTEVGLRWTMIIAAAVAALCFWPLLASPLTGRTGPGRGRTAAADPCTAAAPADPTSGPPRAPRR